MTQEIVKTAENKTSQSEVDDQARRELLARIYRLILSSDWKVEEDERENELGQTIENQPAG
jgi:hypothetical protein